MAENIKFKCTCGKILAADPKYAGRKAKCASCGQSVVIPAPTSAAAPPAARPASESPITKPSARSTKRDTPPARLVSKPKSKVAPPRLKEKSIFDEEGEYEIEKTAAASCPICGQTMPPGALTCPYCGDPLAGKSPLKKMASSNKRRWPIWAYFIPFGIYLVLGWIVGKMAPAGLLFLTMPVAMLGALIFFIGFMWYYFILLRDHPGEAAFLFFGVIAAAFLGVRGSSIGRTSRQLHGERAANPAHRRPTKMIVLGVSLFAAGMSVLLIVGFTGGVFSKIGAKRGFNHPPPFSDSKW